MKTTFRNKALKNTSTKYFYQKLVDLFYNLYEKLVCKTIIRLILQLINSFKNYIFILIKLFWYLIQCVCGSSHDIELLLTNKLNTIFKKKRKKTSCGKVFNLST